MPTRRRRRGRRSRTRSRSRRKPQRHQSRTSRGRRRRRRTKSKRRSRRRSRSRSYSRPRKRQKIQGDKIKLPPVLVPRVLQFLSQLPATIPLIQNSEPVSFLSNLASVLSSLRYFRRHHLAQPQYDTLSKFSHVGLSTAPELTVYFGLRYSVGLERKHLEFKMKNPDFELLTYLLGTGRSYGSSLQIETEDSKFQLLHFFNINNHFTVVFNSSEISINLLLKKENEKPFFDATIFAPQTKMFEELTNVSLTMSLRENMPESAVPLALVSKDYRFRVKEAFREKKL